LKPLRTHVRKGVQPLAEPSRAVRINQNQQTRSMNQAQTLEVQNLHYQVIGTQNQQLSYLWQNRHKYPIFTIIVRRGAQPATTPSKDKQRE